MNAADVTALVGVERADVYKAGWLAGRLRRERDDVVFEYAAEYLTDPATPTVAVTLPPHPPTLGAELRAR